MKVSKTEIRFKIGLNNRKPVCQKNWY